MVAPVAVVLAAEAQVVAVSEKEVKEVEMAVEEKGAHTLLQ